MQSFIGTKSGIGAFTRDHGITLIEIASGKERGWVSIEHSISVMFFQGHCPRHGVILYRFFDAHNEYVNAMRAAAPDAGSKAFLSIPTACSHHLPSRFSSSICLLRSSSTPSLVLQCASNPSTISLTPLISFSTPFKASPALLLPSPLSRSRISFRL